MWKHVLPPVLLVITFWLVISLSTTVYMNYSDKVLQRILRQHVASIDASSDVQVACWRMLALDLNGQQPSDGPSVVSQNAPPRDSGLTEAIALLGATLSTDRERELFETITSNQAIVEAASASHSEQNTADSLQKLTLRNSLERIGEAALAIRGHNGKLIEYEEQNQRKLQGRLLLFRNAALILGPLIGIVVGWRITARLQRRISTLAITLRSAASNTVYTVGEYSLEGADDLREIQHLSEQIVTHMQRVGRELERAELEIIQSERLAAVGELAAGVAHELRNPLTSIKLFLQHAATENNCGKIEISNLDLILGEIRRMETTIQGLLDFSRPASMTHRIHDIRVPLQRAITLISGRAIANGIEVMADISPEPMLVNGDIEQFHLVFVNLLINAVESMPDGGKVEVTARESLSDRNVQICFRDYGHGISADIQKRLFEPFATTKKSGTGLGLAICHRIMTSHKGALTATNMTDGGALFQVNLKTASATNTVKCLA